MADYTARADIESLTAIVDIITRFLSEQFPDEWGTPPADVCDDCDGECYAHGPDCPAKGMAGDCGRCPKCDGTGDRPAVTERRIRETVEGKGAMKVMSAEARLLHIANLLGTEYVPTEKLPGWEPPAVTDAEVEAAILSLIEQGVFLDDGGFDDRRRSEVRAALEAAAAARQEKP